MLIQCYLDDLLAAETKSCQYTGSCQLIETVKPCFKILKYLILQWKHLLYYLYKKERERKRE